MHEGAAIVGEAEVYDDRIFAFAALISDVLVYNLAETIKQADIERLAFAAQLSHEFWRRVPQAVLATATPSADVLDMCDGKMANLVVRPTGVVDPEVTVINATDAGHRDVGNFIAHKPGSGTAGTP